MARNVIFDASGLAAVVAVFVGARRVDPSSMLRLLVVFAIGLGCAFAGAVVAVHALAGYGGPAPSLADIFYVSGYSVLAIVLLARILWYLRPFNWVHVLDGAITAVGGLAFAWIFLMNSLVDGPVVGIGAKLMVVALPFLDLLVLSAMVVILSTHGKFEGVFRLLVASVIVELGVGVFFVSDLVHDRAVTGGFVPAGFMLATGLLGSVALHPSLLALTRPSIDVREFRRSTWALMGLAMMMPPAALVIQQIRHLNDEETMLATLSAVLFGLVLLRVALTARDLDDSYSQRAKAEAERVKAEMAKAEAERSRLEVEVEHELLQRRVNQTERLESLGQLAGGVAHDFNNLLFVILNYAGFAREKLVDMPEASIDIEKIELAARQAGALTRRLLTFAGREIVKPRSVALNDQIANLVEFLGQTLGEDIELVIRPLATFDSVMADPGQIEQVLLNVVLNSRDAMPNGGKLTIETKDFEIDSKRAFEYPTLSEGRYILLEITDTGSGMNSTALEHIFEPFFTTKSPDKGTGLGMSMAFGVIAEAGGDIHFSSELGVGTTCRILLPLCDEVALIKPDSHDVSVQGHAETILVVEDVIAIREMIEKMLSTNGYNVIVPASSPEAIALLETDARMIDLLLTDVIMPEKSGRAVANTFISVRPQGPVIFISGYADPSVLEDVNYKYTLLQKPFSEKLLLITIRNNLDRANSVDSESM